MSNITSGISTVINIRLKYVLEIFKIFQNAKPTKDETDNERLIESYRYMGYYFLLQKDKANSVMYWNKILEIDPENAMAKQALGLAEQL